MRNILINDIHCYKINKIGFNNLNLLIKLVTTFGYEQSIWKRFKCINYRLRKYRNIRQYKNNKKD